MIRRDNKEIDDESIYPMIEDLEPAISSQAVSQLEQMGITPGKIHRNFQVKKLIELVIEKNEALLTANGAVSVRTGKYTGRSPDDRFIVDHEQTHDSVDWGERKHPFAEHRLDKLFEQ